MSKLEKFALATGIIGLTVDVIGLTTFLAGIWNPESMNSTSSELPVIYQVIFGLTTIYGWLSISWILVRRAFVNRESTKKDFPNTVLRVAIGVGILVLPLAMAWWTAVAQGDIAQQKAEIEQRQILRVTQTAQAILTPVATNSTEVATPTLVPRGGGVGEDYVDIGPYLFCSPVMHIVLGIGVYLVLSLLMPIVYPDMPEESIEMIIGKLFSS